MCYAYVRSILIPSVHVDSSDINILESGNAEVHPGHICFLI